MEKFQIIHWNVTAVILTRYNAAVQSNSQLEYVCVHVCLCACESHLSHQECCAQRSAAFWQWQLPGCFLKGHFGSRSSFSSLPGRNLGIFSIAMKCTVNSNASLSPCPHLQQLFCRQAEFRQRLGNFPGVFGESVGDSSHHSGSFSTAALRQEESDISVRDQTTDCLMKTTGVSEAHRRVFKNIFKTKTVKLCSKPPRNTWQTNHNCLWHKVTVTQHEWMKQTFPSLTAGAFCIAIRRSLQWSGVAPRLCSPLASAGCRPARPLSGWQSGKTRWHKPGEERNSSAAGNLNWMNCRMR